MERADKLGKGLCDWKVWKVSLGQRWGCLGRSQLHCSFAKVTRRGASCWGGFLQRAAYGNWSHLQSLLSLCPGAAEQSNSCWKWWPFNSFHALQCYLSSRCQLTTCVHCGLWLWRLLFFWHHFYSDFPLPFLKPKSSLCWVSWQMISHPSLPSSQRIWKRTFLPTLFFTSKSCSSSIFSPSFQS